MKVLLINGSPKKAGCTFTALNEVAKSLNEEGIETEIFQVGVKPIAGCIGCGSCRKTGKCVFDDVVNECMPKAKEADAIIVGSPVHYASASGAITSFMDRLFYSSGGALQSTYKTFYNIKHASNQLMLLEYGSWKHSRRSL